MLKNYLKIAWRNLRQNKSYTIINFSGLALGMTCCILIALYVKSELSYDSFNKNINRIVAVGTYNKPYGRIMVAPYSLTQTLKKEIPEVKKTVVIRHLRPSSIGLNKKNLIKINNAFYTQPSFFDIFSFKLLKGVENKALSGPNSILLTKKLANRLFGKKVAVGQSLIWQRRYTTQLLHVTGIVSNPPQNSSIQFEAILSMNTLDMNKRINRVIFAYNSFVLLNKQATLSQFNASLKRVAKKIYKGNSTSGLFSIPLSSYHLSSYTQQSGFTGNRVYLYLFGSIALFILLLACINYMNLATARATTRVREIGVRKTLGAGRLQLAVQFIGESVFLCVCSFLVSVFFSYLLINPFNYLFGSTIVLGSNFPLLGWLLLAAIIVGILAGCYPALYLSGFSPISIFSDRQPGRMSKGVLRKSLVVAQFIIACVFIIASVIVYRQLHFTQTVDLGFNANQLVSFQLPTRRLGRNWKSIQRSTASVQGVQEVSSASAAPGNFPFHLSTKPDRISAQAKTNSKKPVTFYPAYVDYNYLSVLGINLLAGRNFSPDHPLDQSSSFVLNKKAATAMGWTPKGAIGKSISLLGIKGKVIGVTNNYHIQSLHHPIKPVILRLASSKSSGLRTLLIKLNSDNIPHTIAAIKSKLKTFAPYETFNHTFIGKEFDAMYRSDHRFGHVVGIFAFIAVFIACLGLFGLATFAASRRTKEIGIRKVMGANVRNIVSLLSKDFLKLVAIGFVIAVPIGWYAMHRWLQSFAYKIYLRPWIFILAGAIAFLIALATVGWQSIRAALANPVDSLRSE